MAADSSMRDTLEPMARELPCEYCGRPLFGDYCMVGYTSTSASTGKISHHVVKDHHDNAPAEPPDPFNDPHDCY